MTAETLAAMVAAIKPLDTAMMEKMKRHLEGLLKPLGSLGRLEELAVQLAGISGRQDISYPNKSIIVFCADHGVFAEGVAITPQRVTAIQAANMVKGLTGVCAIANSVNAEIVVVDIGIKCLPIDKVLDHKIRPGCSNIMTGAAMSRDEALQVLATGIKVAKTCIANGASLIGVGELGIANTTPASAIVSLLCNASVDEVVGLGANLPQARLQHKVSVVKQAIAINRPDVQDPIEVLAKVGGFELGGMAGAMIGSAVAGIPVILDGFLSYAAALIACRLAPALKYYLIPSHLSAEKGANIALQQLGLRPYINMEMRLGEGSGAALAMPIIDAACSIVNRMGHLDDDKIEFLELK